MQGIIMRKLSLTSILLTLLLPVALQAQSFTGTYELIGAKVIYTDIARFAESADDTAANYLVEAHWPNVNSSMFSAPLAGFMPGDTVAVLETPDVLLLPIGLAGAGIDLTLGLDMEQGTMLIPGVEGSTATYPTIDEVSCSTFATVAPVTDNATISYSTSSNSYNSDAGTFTWGFGMSQSDVFDWFDAPADWEDPTNDVTNYGILTGYFNSDNTGFEGMDLIWYAEDGQDSDSGIDSDGILNRNLGITTAPGDVSTVPALAASGIPVNVGTYPILGGTGVDLDGDGEPDGVVDTDWGYYFDPNGADGIPFWEQPGEDDSPFQFTGYYMTYNGLAALSAILTAAGDDADGDGIPDNLMALIVGYMGAGYPQDAATLMALADVIEGAFVAWAAYFGVDATTATAAAAAVVAYAQTTYAALVASGDPDALMNTAMATTTVMGGVLNAMGIDIDDSDHDYDPTSTTSDNQLANSGFEDGFTSWEVYPHGNSQAMIGTGEVMYNTTETFVAFEGDSARKLWGLYEGGTNMENNVFQTYWGTLGAYTQFDVSAEIYTNSADDLNQGNGYGVLFAKYFYDGWAWAGMDSVHFRGAPDTWHHQSVSCTVPLGVAIVQVGVMHVQPSNDDHGSFYVDDFSMHINYPFPNGRLVFQIGNSCVPVFEARDVFVSFATVEEAGVISEDILPEKFAVYDNYPNPFNPTTQISFDLTENSVTEVSVWNLLGQKITTLYTGDLNAGHHTVKFDGKDSNGSILPSGVYIYRVAAGNNVSTKKMMLLK